MRIKSLKHLKKNKKGSHLGVILSLVFFVGFLVFLYFITGPMIKTQKDKQFVVDYLEVKLAEQFSSNLRVVNINTEGAPQNCIQLSNFINDVGIDAQVIVKNSEGDIQTSNVIGEDLEIDRSSVADVFFQIYYSGEFENAGSQATDPCNQRTYSVESMTTNQEVFETKITETIDYYNDNYDELKEGLKIPAESEFSFEFTRKDGTRVSPQEKDTYLESYVEEVSVKYVDAQANINPGTLKIIVW